MNKMFMKGSVISLIEIESMMRILVAFLLDKQSLVDGKVRCGSILF